MTVSAQVNAVGSPTSYRFEYGTSTAYGESTPATSLGAAQEDATAQAPLSGLLPDTIYHFRVIATNALGTTQGADASLKTFPSPSSALPDGRVYEMVSPLDNQDGNVYPPITGVFIGDAIGTELPVRASADGNSVAYVADPTSGGNGSIAQGGGNSYLARRAANGGWSTENLQPPGYSSPLYQAFSGDLSVAILDAADPTPLPGTDAPEGGYDILYSRTTADGSYHAIITAKPPNRPPGSPGGRPGPFGSADPGEERGHSVLFAGSSTDMSHILFEANDALTPNALDPGVEANNLYDSVGGQLRLVNVLPDGTPADNATFGSPRPADFDIPGLSHVISADGSRIFWTDLSSGNLYVRENGSTTVQVDASQGSGGGGGGVFQTAGSDGSKVFFTDSASAGLTGDTIPGSGVNLYEYDVPRGTLSDLTPSAEASVEGVVGASEDGEYLYFVSAGELAAGATAGQPNLSSASWGPDHVPRHTLAPGQPTRSRLYKPLRRLAARLGAAHGRGHT